MDTNLNLRQTLEGMPIFTSTYQKRATQLQVDNYETIFARIRLWAGVGLFVLLGIMLGTAVLNL